MEHLSNAIKAVFAHQDGDQVLMNAGVLDNNEKDSDLHHKPLYKETPESLLMNLIQKTNVYNTIDQKSIIVQVFQSKWTQPDYSIQSLKFNDEPTVFNALLHFAAGTLATEDNEPICRYHRLLRWHSLTTQLGEDIFTTAFLASRDTALNLNRESYGWDAVIGHDNVEINAVLSRPIADVHMHLNGSSFNFDISWISIMNNFMSLRPKFDELNIKHKDSSEWDSQIYQKLQRAAIIRYYLAGKLDLGVNPISTTDIDIIFNPSKLKLSLSDKNSQYPSLIESFHSFSTIQREINQRDEELLNLYKDDLVLPYEYIPILKRKGNTDEYRMANVLASERKLMYLCFKRIFSSYPIDNDFALLFYAYLTYKTLFRQKILQLNEQVGFANFTKYENRKDIFIIKDKYGPIFNRAAICNFLNDSPNRYLEARLTPRDNASELADKLTQLIDDIKGGIKGDDQQINSELKRLGFVLHFIKSRDELKIKGYRHAELDQKIKRQCLAIYDFRNNQSNWSNGPIAGSVIGIDAANSEIHCRPEVYAQAYRFLRGHAINGTENGARPNDLKFTYHVGEDFLDISDGLRAVEEAIIFLGLKHGDRIGHGLVLGTDVAKYYEKRYFTICASKQVLLDNAAWLHHKCKRLGGPTSLLEYFECLFQKYFNEVYCDYQPNDKQSYYDFMNDSDDDTTSQFSKHIKQLNNIDDYYLSWLLRGNHPKFGVDIARLLQDKISDNVERYWVEASINHHAAAKNAWFNPNARELFDAYHREAIIKRGAEGDTVQIPYAHRKDFIKLLETIQEQMLDKFERKRIGIECNPTSNYKIGELDRYDEHPIFKFNNRGIDTPFKRHDIFVSINTDDLGVFSTSLDREYSLIALAAERMFCKECENTPRQIIDWLDNVRKMSLEQLFLNRTDIQQ